MESFPPDSQTHWEASSSSPVVVNLFRLGPAQSSGFRLQWVRGGPCTSILFTRSLLLPTIFVGRFGPVLTSGPPLFFFSKGYCCLFRTWPSLGLPLLFTPFSLPNFLIPLPFAPPQQGSQKTTGYKNDSLPLFFFLLFFSDGGYFMFSLFTFPPLYGWRRRILLG